MKSPLITGFGDSTMVSVKVPVSTVVLPDLRKTVMVKVPAFFGFPLKTPCRLKISPGGTPVALQKSFLGKSVLSVENFTLGFGDEEGGGYGNLTIPSDKLCGEMVAKTGMAPKKKAARMNKARDIVEMINLDWSKPHASR